MNTQRAGYYKILKDINKIECLKCAKQLSGINVSNIKRHYKLMHDMDIRSEREKSFREDESQVPPSSKKPKFNNKISIDIDKNKFLKCCVGIVVTKNIPFHIFDDQEYFKTLISPYEKQFGTNLNSRNLVSVLESSTTTIQEIITKRLRNKMVSLKIDIATRMDKSILGINIQYIKDFKIYINTLGMIQLQKKHTALNIKDDILECLRIYKIDIGQIYSNITDNGINVIKESRILQEPQEEQICNELGDIESPPIEDGNEKMHISLASVLSAVRCVAHTIQLAAYDVLKELEPKINECRRLIKELRTYFRTVASDIQMPVLDNATRWNSTYEMLKSLLNIKDYLDTVLFEATYSQIYISWDFITDFVAAFSPLANCTKQLQSEQYIVGDFYRDWLSCEVELEDLFSTTPYAAMLHEAMHCRKEFLLENDAFISALFLDPRFNFINSVILSEEQKTRAMTHLVNTFQIIKQLETLDIHTQSEQPEYLSDSESQNQKTEYCSESESDEPTTSKSAYAKLEQRIINLASSTPKAKETERTIEQKLILLSNSTMVSLDTDILGYWKTMRIDSDIKKIINVALAIPATQISVERAFSALSIIFSKSNSKLSNTTLNNLLLTKLNFPELNPKHVQIDCADDLTE